MATSTVVTDVQQDRQAVLAVKREPAGPAQNNVTTSLNYYNDPGDGSSPEPVYVKTSTVTNKRATVAVPVIVTDITGQEKDFALDSHGFQLVRHEVKAQCQKDGYKDDVQIEAEYYPEMEQLLKDVTGASRVFIFDHKTRHGPTNWHSLGAGNQALRGPILRAHVDQSYAGAELDLKWHLPDDADQLLGCRWQIINAWRPIKTVYKDPLAVADANTVAEEDLVAARIIYEDHERETWTVKPSPAHRWFFKYAQNPDEVLLIKCYDSLHGVARRAPHSAFQNPQHVDGAWRESIEIRTMVFYDDRRVE